MSHNKITVGGKTPDTAGEIAVDLNDLSDVSGSPSTGDALVYGGAGWGPSNPGLTAATTLPYSAYNTYDGYGGSAKYISVNDYVMFSHYRWRTNMIGGPYSGSIWVQATKPPSQLSLNSKYLMAFDLPAGVWLIDCTPNFTFTSSSNYIDVAWYDVAGNQYSSLFRFQIGRAYPVNVWAIINLSSPARVSIY